jgi:glycosyltransferase involved in cell wall biosynthesis
MDSPARPFKIGVFSKPLDNWTSGSGHHLDEMMKHVLDLNDANGRPFDFTFIHYSKSANPIYGRVRELLIPRNPILASLALKAHRFDILHYSPLSVYAPMFALKAKKIATIHGAEEAIYPEGYSFVARIHERFAMPVLARKLDRIATVSETSRQYYIKEYRVSPERVFLTVNGISPAMRVLDRKSLTVPAKIGVTGPYIFHISRYSTRKNPRCVLEGFARFSANNPGFSLVCAGKGWDCEEVRARAKNLAIADKLITPGFIDESEAVELLNGAMAFLFPSFAEGFGMPNVEAMACGCPVVTSSAFAIPEVTGGAAVLLKDANDYDECASALGRIALDRAYREELVRKGLSRAGRFDWNESAAALMRAYREMVGIQS